MILHNPLHAALSSNTQYLQITADNKDLLTSQNGTKFFDVRNSVVEGHLGEDLAVMQVNSGVDAFQLSVSGSHLIVRQNDNPGTADWPATFYTVMNQGDTAAAATKLATSRTFPAVNLAGTSGASFDGSANPTALGVTGTLPINHGGTGSTTAAAARTALGITAANLGAVSKSGDTMTGTLVLSKSTDASGTANNSPALIVGGQPTGQHIEIDGNEIMAKSNATTPSFLGLNNDGGRVIAGPDGFEGYLHGTADIAKKLDAPEFTDETDLNNLTTFGIYKFRNTVNNRPVNPGGTLIVLNTDSTYITQLAFSNSSAGTNSFHVRTHGANGWTAWQKVL